MNAFANDEEECRKDLFFFDGSYMEIRLQHTCGGFIPLRMLYSADNELEDYLKGIDLSDLPM